MAHEITRIRREPKRRSLIVREVVALSPAMRRIVLSGDELAGFESDAPDDHIKLFFPGKGEKPEMRDWTPRRFDAAANTLTLDFALHEAGPASDWARHAKPGDTLAIGGPRGSTVVPASFDWFLLIGDETALPAIGRWIEELPVGKPVTSLVAVPAAADEQRFETAADHRALWVHRPAIEATDAAPLLAALETFARPEGDGFVFVAAEARVAHALRDFLVGPFRQPREWLRASGYWVKDAAGESRKGLEGEGKAAA